MNGFNLYVATHPSLFPCPRHPKEEARETIVQDMSRPVRTGTARPTQGGIVNLSDFRRPCQHGFYVEHKFMEKHSEECHSPCRSVTCPGGSSVTTKDLLQALIEQGWKMSTPIRMDRVGRATVLIREEQ